MRTMLQSHWSPCSSLATNNAAMALRLWLGGSFAFVFALRYQKQNLFYRRYFPTVVNVAFIASPNLLVVKMESQATLAEMLV
ncbi:MAG: hypothetical protein M0Z99_24725 [Betaproteobacteria bacterium]|nr:hypothetical protein [Betaproteobacteria bacterium]